MIDCMNLSRRGFVKATGLALLASQVQKTYAQRDLFPDGNMTVFEKRSNVSFKLDDLMPAKYERFKGILSLDCYIGETGTEFFKLHFEEIVNRMERFFSDVGIKTNVTKVRRKLHRYTSATSMGVELISPEDFDKRMSDLHIPIRAEKFSGFYGGAQRMAFCRYGKEYKNPMIAAKLATHEILHGFSLLHPDAFVGMEEDGSVMSRAPTEEQTFNLNLPIGQKLADRQIGQLHSFLRKGNPYWAFLKANYDSNSLAIEVAKASGLSLNTSSMNK